jgi:hypothetical protein
MLTIFNINLGSAVYCGDWLSIDETLYPMKHNVSFRWISAFVSHFLTGTDTVKRNSGYDTVL